MPLKLTNSMSYGALSAPVGIGAVTIPLASGHGARFDSLAAGEYQYAVIIDNNETAYARFEAIRITARAGDNLTVDAIATAFPITGGAPVANVKIAVANTVEQLRELIQTTYPDAVAGAGPLTLVYNSPQILLLTPAADIDQTLPTSSVAAGRPFIVVNLSGAFTVTVKASGGATILAIPPGGSAHFIANQAAPTLAAHWSVPVSHSYGSTLDVPILNIPQIANFTSAGHAHQNAAGGGALAAPVISSFVNAGHSHQNAAGGGGLDAAALTFGTLPSARFPATLPSGLTIPSPTLSGTVGGVLTTFSGTMSLGTADAVATRNTLVLLADTPRIYFGTAAGQRNWMAAAGGLTTGVLDIAVGDTDTDPTDDAYTQILRLYAASRNIIIGTIGEPSGLSTGLVMQGGGDATVSPVASFAMWARAHAGAGTIWPYYRTEDGHVGYPNLFNTAASGGDLTTGASGYIKLPGGLIVQWVAWDLGDATLDIVSKSVTGFVFDYHNFSTSVFGATGTFPIAFTTTTYVVLLTSSGWLAIGT